MVSTYVCIGTIEEDNGEIAWYRLASSDGKRIKVTPEKLIEALDAGAVYVNNIHRLKSGRIKIYETKQAIQLKQQLMKKNNSGNNSVTPATSVETYTCIDRIQDDKNKTTGYILQSKDGKELRVGREELKTALIHNKIAVTNICIDPQGTVRLLKAGKRELPNYKESGNNVRLAKAYHNYYLATGNGFSGNCYNALERQFCVANGVNSRELNEWVQKTTNALKQSFKNGDTTSITIRLAENYCPELLDFVNQGLVFTARWEQGFNEAINYAFRENPLSPDRNNTYTPKTRNSGALASYTGRDGVGASHKDKPAVKQWMTGQYKLSLEGKLDKGKEAMIRRILPGMLDTKTTEATIDYISSTLNYTELIKYRGF